MQLKNNTPGNVQFHYVNSKNDVDYIHIPAGATVELDDKVFADLCKPLSPVRTHELVVAPIDGDVPVLMDKKDVLIKEFYPTGDVKYVNLLKQRIAKGDFTVVVRPEVSKEQIAETLKKHGIDFSKMDEPQIMALYDKLA